MSQDTAPAAVEEAMAPHFTSRESTPLQEIRLRFMEYSCTQPPPFLLEHARKALGETPENRAKGLHEMRTILRNDPDVEFADEETILLMYLRFKKFDAKKAAEFFKLGLRYLDSYRYLVERKNPDLIRRVIRSNVVGFLQFRDEGGRAIIYVRSALWDPDTMSPEEVILGGVVAIQSAIYNPVNQMAGYVIVFDLKDLRVQQVLAMTRWIVFGVLTLQRACPAFMKAFHVINIPPLYKMGWKIAKPLLSDKIKRRFIFHKSSDIRTLHQHIPPEILPPELGGSVPFSNEHWAWDLDSIEASYYQRLSQNGYKSRRRRKDESLKDSAKKNDHI